MSNSEGYIIYSKDGFFRSFASSKKEAKEIKKNWRNSFSKKMKLKIKKL